MRSIGKFIGSIMDEIWSAFINELNCLWFYLLSATIPAIILTNLPVERVWKQWPVEWSWAYWMMLQLLVYLIFRIFYLQRRSAK